MQTEAMKQSLTPVLLELDEVISGSALMWTKIKNRPAPETLMHLGLASSFPLFRMFNLVINLHPETTSTRLGHCQGPEVDWAGFRALVNQVQEMVTAPQPATHCSSV
jgi:hypothetical protein